MGDVIELFGSQARSGGWTEQEKAELYRAASLLGARGLPFDTEFGVSDDGDPWFLFVGRGTGEVLVHFARIEGMFVVHHAATDVVFEAEDIRDLVDRVLVFPERSVGRASGDAMHAHLAVTVAALSLSLEGFSFFDPPHFESVPADADAPAPTPEADPSWLVPEDPAPLSSAEDTQTAATATERDTDAPDPQPQVHAVEVKTGEEMSVDPEEGRNPVEEIADDFAFSPDHLADRHVFGFSQGNFNGVVVQGSTANDTLIGTDSSDFMAGGDGHDLIIAGGGDDMVMAGSGDDTVLGGDGNDVVAGEDGQDLLYGGRGNDMLVGGAGDDLLYGGKGDDTLQGVSGHDTLSGDGGDDLLIAPVGEAVMFGGDGTNIFHFAPGEAVAYGGADKDIFVYEESDRAEVVIHDFDPEKDELYYLDAAGERVEVELTPAPDDGEITIQAEDGGSLTIIFDHDPTPMIT